MNINLAGATATGGDAEGDTLLHIENVSGSAFDDRITGDSENNRLVGLEGDDTLVGGMGDDELIGDDGNDSLSAGIGNDTLTGGAGDDVLEGGIGNDLLSGGQGNDVLKGEAGDDTYLFNIGDGENSLIDTAGVDKIVFGAGITIGNIQLSLDDSELHWVIELLGPSGEVSGDKIVIHNANFSTDHQIEYFEFSDGTVLDEDGIQELLLQGPNEQVVIYGTDNHEDVIGFDSDDTIYAGLGNDFVYGRKGDDTLYGEGGSDVLRGEEGNDIIIGGAGEDNLEGGTGNDTYLFGYGDESDSLYDSGGIDKIVFGEGITTENVQVTITGDESWLFWRVELVNNGQTTGDEIWISDVQNVENQIETFEFADGTVLGKEEFLALTGDSSSGDSNEYDIIDGVVYVGTDDNNIYHHAYGENWVYQETAGGVDTIVFGEGIDPNLVQYSFNEDGMSLWLPDDTTALASIYGTIERFEFADGTLWELGSLPTENEKVYEITGTDSSDTINGTSGNDTINGGKGDDILNGGNGDDLSFRTPIRN